MRSEHRVHRTWPVIRGNKNDLWNYDINNVPFWFSEIMEPARESSASIYLFNNLQSSINELKCTLLIWSRVLWPVSAPLPFNAVSNYRGIFQRWLGIFSNIVLKSWIRHDDDDDGGGHRPSTTTTRQYNDSQLSCFAWPSPAVPLVLLCR